MRPFVYQSEPGRWAVSERAADEDESVPVAELPTHREAFDLAELRATAELSRHWWRTVHTITR